MNSFFLVFRSAVFHYTNITLDGQLRYDAHHIEGNSYTVAAS